MSLQDVNQTLKCELCQTHFTIHRVPVVLSGYACPYCKNDDVIVSRVQYRVIVDTRCTERYGGPGGSRCKSHAGHAPGEHSWSRREGPPLEAHQIDILEYEKQQKLPKEIVNDTTGGFAVTGVIAGTRFVVGSRVRIQLDTSAYHGCEGEVYDVNLSEPYEPEYKVQLDGEHAGRWWKESELVLLKKGSEKT